MLIATGIFILKIAQYPAKYYKYNYNYGIFFKEKDNIKNAVKNNMFSNYTILSIEECSEATVIHKLSHQHLHVQFWKIKITDVLENGIDLKTLKTFPFPVVIYNFIEKQEINC